MEIYLLYDDDTEQYTCAEDYMFDPDLAETEALVRQCEVVPFTFDETSKIMPTVKSFWVKDPTEKLDKRPKPPRLTKPIADVIVEKILKFLK